MIKPPLRPGTLVPHGRRASLLPLVAALAIAVTAGCGDGDSSESGGSGCTDPACYDTPGGGQKCVCADPGAEPAYEPQPQPWRSQPPQLGGEKVRVQR